jgi:hypothetical protein
MRGFLTFPMQTASEGPGPTCGTSIGALFDELNERLLDELDGAEISLSIA